MVELGLDLSKPSLYPINKPKSEIRGKLPVTQCAKTASVQRIDSAKLKDLQILALQRARHQKRRWENGQILSFIKTRFSTSFACMNNFKIDNVGILINTYFYNDK